MAAARSVIALTIIYEPQLLHLQNGLNFGTPMTKYEILSGVGGDGDANLLKQDSHRWAIFSFSYLEVGMGKLYQHMDVRISIF